MRLIDDWRLILRKAWSIKFVIAAAILSGAEVAVAWLQPFGMPNGMFAAGAGVVSVFAFGARMLAQKEIQDASSQATDK